MKVSELIEALQQQDPNIEVAVEVAGVFSREPSRAIYAEVVEVIGQDRRGPNPKLLLRAEVD